jgi:hypothetical protein
MLAIHFTLGANVKALIVFSLLALCLLGFAYGIFHHSRFIKEGGQSGFNIVPSHLQTKAMRKADRGMRIGYGVFFVTLATMLFISAKWGPVGT